MSHEVSKVAMKVKESIEKYFYGCWAASHPYCSIPRWRTVVLQVPPYLTKRTLNDI